MVFKLALHLFACRVVVDQSDKGRSQLEIRYILDDISRDSAVYELDAPGVSARGEIGVVGEALDIDENCSYYGDAHLLSLSLLFFIYTAKMECSL